MNRETFDHILEDVRNAMVEAPIQGDLSLMPELVMYLVDEIGRAATEQVDIVGECPSCSGDYSVSLWAGALLEKAQLRAISKIPFAEADACDQADAPYDPDWRDHA